MRAFLRWLGFHVHKGWRSTHPSGSEKQCIGCGEQRSEYMLWVEHSDVTWWETSRSGDGSCGPIKELPTRIC